MSGTRRILWIPLLLLTGVWSIEACRKKEPEVQATETIRLEVPPNFPPPNDIFQNNPLSKAGIQLGRKLFYDGRLAKDGQTSCASCHQQFAAFATFDHPLSHGVDNQFTTRNAPGLFNLAWQKELHWDGGINHLEVQPLAPITATNEMGEEVVNILKKLNADAEYRTLFKAAFGNSEATSQSMLKALSQFMGTIVSAGSKYDQVQRGKAGFSQAEASGYAIFKAKCVSCHKEPLFTDLSYRNIGLPLYPVLNDIGRMRITGSRADSLKFKVPSLRNVALTAPYGHDGRFHSLSGVIEHYRAQVVDGPTLDPLLKKKISISDNERSDLIQFLGTLTDTPFIKDPRFAAPQ